MCIYIACRWSLFLNLVVYCIKFDLYMRCIPEKDTCHIINFQLSITAISLQWQLSCIPKVAVLNTVRLYWPER